MTIQRYKIRNEDGDVVSVLFVGATDADVDFALSTYEREGYDVSAWTVKLEDSKGTAA